MVLATSNDSNWMGSSPSLEARQLDEAREQRTGRANALLQQSVEVIAQRGVYVRLGEQGGRVRDHPHTAPQIMSRFAQQFRALLLEGLNRTEGFFEIANPSGRCGLMQADIARSALAVALHAQRCKHLACLRHDLAGKLRMLRRVAIEFPQQHGLKMTPLAHGLPNVISLLPPMDAVLGRVLALLEIDPGCIERMLCPQSTREVIEDLRKVIIEGAARKPRARRELGIIADCLSPEREERIATLLKVQRQSVQFLLYGSNDGIPRGFAH